MKVIKFRNRKCLYFEGELYKQTGFYHYTTIVSRKYFKTKSEIICNFLNWYIIFKCEFDNSITLYKNADLFIQDEEPKYIMCIKNTEEETEYNIEDEFKKTYLRKEKIKKFLNG